MPQRKIGFENQIPYHISSRGVDRRPLFLNTDDYARFIFQLYTANFDIRINNIKPALAREVGQLLLSGGKLPANFLNTKHKPLVYLMCFALLPNHFHLLLLQNAENGIQQLMHRLLTGYAMYFNLKTERQGALFQGRFRAIPIRDELQLDTVMCNININPLSVWQPNWRKDGLKNWSRALQFLKNYPWSSYPDFIAARPTHLLPPRRILSPLYSDFTKYSQETWYKRFVEGYVRGEEDIKGRKN